MRRYVAGNIKNYARIGMMQAIVNKSYGPPEEVMELEELQVPTPKGDEVLIEIYATAINDYDWSMARGQPFLYRLLFGIFRPKNKISGMELSGIIQAVGSNVEKWQIGDAVYGDTSDFGFGTFAEFICIHQDAIYEKPSKMSFEDAAALPHASLLALQAFKNNPIKEQQTILINGAGGGVGTIALQLAKLNHAETTGVDSGTKLPFLKAIGFDHVIDYKISDFTRTGKQYDLILDCKSTRSAFSIFRALRPGGIYVTIGGKLSTLINLLLWGKLCSFISTKKIRIQSLRPNDGLDRINSLFKEGKIKSTIDGPYGLEEIPSLVSYFGAGAHKGKIVIKVK